MKKTKKAKVVVGGTFDIIHQGHKALLKRGFELGELVIGLTSDALVKKMKKRKIKKFNIRKKELEKFIKKEFAKKTKIIKIEDKFGPTLKEDFDYIVVSPATYKTAVLINRERQKRNKKLIRIVKIKYVLSKDGKPISATRIIQNKKEG